VLITVDFVLLVSGIAALFL